MLAMRLGLVLAVATIVLGPLAVAPGLLEAFRLPKLIVSELLGLLSVALLVIGGGRQRTLRELIAEPAVQTAVPLAIVASATWLWTGHRAHVAEAIPHLLAALTCLVGWSLFLPRPRRLLDWLLVPATMLAVVAVLQNHGVWNPFVVVRQAERQQLTSLVGNVGDLGAYLALAAVIAQAGFLRCLKASRLELGRFVYALAAGLCLYALLLTQTLAAIAAVGAASALLWLALLPMRRRLQAGAVVAVVATVAIFAVAPLRSRVVDKVGELGRGEVNALLTGRLDGWRAARWMFSCQPIVGVGLGAYVAEFTPAKLELTEQGVPFFDRHGAYSTFGNAHNEPAEVMAEMGLLGGAAMLWALVVLWRRGVAALVSAAPPTGDRGEAAAGGATKKSGKKKSGKKPKGKRAQAEREAQAWAERVEAWMVISLLLALFILALVYFPFRIALTGYAAVAILTVVLSRDRDPSRSTAEPSDRRLLRSVLALLAGAAVVAFALIQARSGLDRIRASRLLFITRAQVFELQQRGVESKQVLRNNLKILRDARRLDPSEPALLQSIGAHHLQLDNPSAAERSFREALELEPRPEGYFSLGQALAAKGDRAGAIAAFERAVRLDPGRRQAVPRDLARELGP